MNKMFFLFAFVLLAIGFSGCEEELEEILPGTEQPGDDETDDDGLVIEITTPENDSVASNTSKVFTLNLKGVQQIAYEVVENVLQDDSTSVMPQDSTDVAPQDTTRTSAEDENERGKLIFKNATLEGGSGIIDAVEGENVVEVKNLEGNKTYTVHFAFKTGEDTYKVRSQEFSTSGYSQIITVLSVSTEGFKVHVEMPDSVYWRWGYTQADTYFEMQQFGNDDLSILSYNGDLWLKGSQTLDIKNGEVWYEMETEIYDEETWEVIGTEKEPVYHTIFPGYSYIFLLAECDEEGVINYSTDWGDEGGWDDWGVMNKLPNVLNYTEEWTSDYITFEGKYAKVQFDVDAPALQPSQLTIETVKQTERRAVYNIIPSENTVQYAVTILPMESYEMLEGWTGKDAAKWVALNYNSGIFTDAQQIEVGPLDANTSYKMLVYGSYSDDSMLMSCEEFTVTSTPSDKPAAELTVTPLSAERIKELDGDPAYMVGYNVKCAEGNCAGVKYIANYASAWDELLSYGYTNEEILDAYGVDIFEADDPEFIKGVNSAEGYDVTFTCTEKSEMVMAIASYNSDEKVSEMIVSRVTSGEEWGTNPIESSLFTELAGDWTASYKYVYPHYNEMWELVNDTIDATFKMTITDGVYQGPDAMDADTYNSLVNYYIESGDDEATAKAKVDDNFADFKLKAKHYADKYRSLNRMVVTGFEPLHAYKSAWDLAVDLNHSAVDNDDLFYDFGPKMFLQISENGATLNSNLERFPPVSSWYKADGYYVQEYYLLGCNGVDYLSDVQFPVEISDDKQTLTIKAIDGAYYPSVGYSSYGWEYGASFQALGLSEIVLTKGWNGAEETRSRVAKAGKGQKFSARRGAHRLVKTKLPHSKDAVTILEKTTIDPSVAGKKVIKDMKRRQSMIEKMKK